MFHETWLVVFMYISNIQASMDNAPGSMRPP